MYTWYVYDADNIAHRTCFIRFVGCMQHALSLHYICHNYCTNIGALLALLYTTIIQWLWSCIFRSKFSDYIVLFWSSFFRSSSFQSTTCVIGGDQYWRDKGCGLAVRKCLEVSAEKTLVERPGRWNLIIPAPSQVNSARPCQVLGWPGERCVVENMTLWYTQF